ncbi:MAG TPA: iron-containing alcohol dehydrogenase family protein [Nitrolancea sp.]|nr:iron-containing alcohol dehydrogenase family protein [Nitrolancea sp.]
MPLLARMLATPLVIDVRPGAISGLGALLADRRIAVDGRVAVAVGPGQGESIAAELDIGSAELFKVPDGSYDTAVALGKDLRAGTYEAVAGIGGGKTIDVTKFAAHMAGIPMVSVATSLGHDGIASPVSTLAHESGSGSYGVVTPVAIVVDLDRVRRAPARLATAGIGDVVNDLSAIADWELSAADTGEPVDGLAVAMARSAAHAVLNLPGEAASDEFLTVLAEALIMSGMSMIVAGSSRPASGGDHEIMHAINRLFPGTASHGELAGLGASFCAYLRGDAAQLEAISSCLRRHGLPVHPEQVGLSAEQFTAAVVHAPQTRPGRYTILERLAMTPAQAADRVEDYVSAIAG